MTGVSRPVFARVYQRVSVTMDRAGIAGLRRELVAGLTGRVIEVGAGNGRMFAHYPPGVTEVVAVEPEPRLRAAAHQAAGSAPVPVRVLEGLAESLPVADGDFDAAVTTLVLCSVRDPSAALAEVRRVLKPGGQLVFLEHVAAEHAGRLRRFQRFADATIWPLFTGGCHIGRDTAAAITAAGFTIERMRRFRFPQEAAVAPAAPHIIGSARR